MIITCRLFIFKKEEDFFRYHNVCHFLVMIHETVVFCFFCISKSFLSVYFKKINASIIWIPSIRILSSSQIYHLANGVKFWSKIFFPWTYGTDSLALKTEYIVLIITYNPFLTHSFHIFSINLIHWKVCKMRICIRV